MTGNIWRRIGEGLLAVLMVIGIWYFWQFIQTERVAIQQKRQAQENSPNQQVAQQRVKESLQKHDHDIQRVKNLLLPREAIGDFVGVLEQEAQLSRIKIEVPEIAEDQKFDENHQPIPQTGPYLDVRLKVVGVGDQLQLLQFLHRLENLPYVVRVIAWDINTLRPEDVPALSLVAPVTGPVATVAPTTTPKPKGEISATLILTMRQEVTHD